jgi:hypothetical protein
MALLHPRWFGHCVGAGVPGQLPLAQKTAAATIAALHVPPPHCTAG